MLRGLIVCTLMAVVVSARSGTLAPTTELESFLESGVHSDSEIDAIAKAEVESVLGTESDAESEAPVPPPKKGPVAPSAESSADRDDVIRLVYDELKRLGSASSTTLPAGPGKGPSIAALGKSDPRIQQLEGRLSMFEKKRTEEVNRVQDRAISTINKRLEGLDRTLASLKQSAEKQQALTAQLIRAKKSNSDAKGYVNTQDYSVSYVPETIPADFENRVSDLLSSVKDEARKIYERYCPNCRKPNPPKVYPKEPTPAPKATKKPMIPKNPFKRRSGIDSELAGAIDRMAAEVEANEKSDKQLLDKDIAGDKPSSSKEETPRDNTPAPPAAPTPSAAPRPSPRSSPPPPMSKPPVEPKEDTPKPEQKDDDEGKIRKVLFQPVIIGKEPTPEGLRLSKALNDISEALPVTPAYQLGAKQRALQDVLGSDAINRKFVTKRL